MEKFKTKKGIDETNAMIEFLNGILFYENDRNFIRNIKKAKC